MRSDARQIAECAILLAIGTVLSLFTVSAPWLLGGGVTFCSMLPLVLISFRYGWKYGALAAALFGEIQMFLGMSNVTFAMSVSDSAWMGVGVIFLDYILAYGVVGLAGAFGGFMKNRRKAIIAGIIVTFFLRFVCHYFSGVYIWESIAKNARGWGAEIWSLAYNAAFMIPETIITAAVCLFTYKRMSKYWERQ